MYAKPGSFVVRHRLGWILLAGIVVGCGGAAGTDSTAPPQSAAVSSVSVTGAAALEVGETTQLNAVLKDASGNALGGRTVLWSTSSSTIASVSETGLVTAVAPGSVTITASADGKSGTALLGITTVAVASVEVSLVSSTIDAGRTTEVGAVLKGSRAQVLTGRTIAWSSTAQGVATVSSGGIVTGAAAGTTNIVATVEGKSGSAPLTVTAVAASVASVAVSPSSATLSVGETKVLAATLSDASGNALSGRSISWTSSNLTAASVSAAGLVTAIAPGSAIITAASEGKSGTATITIRPLAASLQISSGQNQAGNINTTLPVPISVVALDANGNPVGGVAITFAVASGGGSVSATNLTSNGTAPVGAAGTTWTLGALVGTQTVVASAAGSPPITFSATAKDPQAPPVPVASVAVSLGSSLITIGATTQATPTAKDANGNVVTGRNVSWSSSTPTVATVSGSGLVTAIGPGTSVITANIEGQTGSAMITVPIAVGSVTVSLGASSITVGSTTQATATANGTTPITTQATWSSTNSFAATVSSSGVVTAVRAGEADIVATYQGVIGKVHVVVVGLGGVRFQIDDGIAVPTNIRETLTAYFEFAQNYFLAKLGRNVSGTVTFIITSRSSPFDQPGGVGQSIVTSGPDHEVTFYPPGLPTLQQTTELRKVVVHEMFHILQAEVNWPGQGGNPSGTSRELPGVRWLAEGTAEYMAIRALSDAGFYNFDAVRSNAQRSVCSTSLPPLSSMEDLNAFYLQASSGSYTLAWLGVNDLLTAGNPSRLRLYWEAASTAPWQDAFVPAFGISLSDFYRRSEEKRTEGCR